MAGKVIAGTYLGKTVEVVMGTPYILFSWNNQSVSLPKTLESIGFYDSYFCPYTNFDR